MHLKFFPYVTYLTEGSLVYEHYKNSSWPQVQSMVRWVKICRHFPLPVVVFVLFNKPDVFFVFLRIIFSCSRSSTIKICLLIFQTNHKSGELFQGAYSLKRKFIFSYCCLFLINSITEYNKHFFFPYWTWTTGMPCFWIHHLSHTINCCWKCFDYLESDSYYQHYHGWFCWRADGA